MILLDAVYINMGGGKVLLDHLMTELENTNEKVFYLLDDRVQNNHIPVKQTNKVQFIKAGIVQRARFYKNNKNTIFPLQMAFDFHLKYEQIHPFEN